jgi:SAM-dependent methyltransferase
MLGARAFASDYSLRALQHASVHNERLGTQTQLAAGDTFHLPYRSDTFDVVFSQGLLEHFSDPVPAVLEQVRVLRPGGILCVDVPQTFSLLTLYKRWHMMQGTWFAGWETDFTLSQLERLLRDQGMELVRSYGWMYFPSIVYGVRNLHTLNERHHLPVWLDAASKQMIEEMWRWLERQRWFYRWLGCIGVIARKPVQEDCECK